MNIKFEPSNNDELVALVREITDNKISREIEEMSIADLDDLVLMGLPEATVITISDGYYAAKLIGNMDDDQKIFKLMMKHRLYSLIDIMRTKIAAPSNLYAFIYNDLCLADAQQYLTLDDMKALVEKYKKIKGISEVEDNF